MSFEMPGMGEAGAPAQARPRRRGVLLPTLIILVLLVGAFVLFANFYTDWLWFVSVDKTEVFTTSLVTRAVMFLGFGLLMGTVVGLSMWLAWRTRPAFRGMTPEQASLERYRMALEPFRRRLTLATSIGLGVIAGLTASSEWGTYLLWRNATEFGITDPQFGMDLSFYTFTLPFIRFLIDYAFAMVILVFVAVLVVQYLYGGLRLQPRGDRATAAAQTQLSVIIGLFVLVKGVSYWFDRFGLATQSQQLVQGFTGLKYTDVNAVLPALNILAAVSVLVALLFFFNALRRHWVIPTIGAGLLILTSVVVGVLYPLFVQQFQVRPSELVREEPYIQRNIDATRDAYGIADAEVSPYPGTVSPPTQATLNASAGTLNNIRLLDPAVVSPTYNQLQQIRGYYAFNPRLDVDRYELDGAKRGAVVAVREINLAGIPDGQRNWTNDRLVYTHGYGFVAAYDNTADSNGQPDFFESDIPSSGALDIEQPRVYFGEFSPAYSIVGAPAGSPPVELDFPDDASATGQANNTYQGTGGVPMGSLLGRVIFATKFQDANILLSDLVNADSRMLWDRDPITRVEKIAPWLTLDQDPYAVVVDGRIKWIVDGYTLSNDYPYSSRVSVSDATSDSVSQRAVPGALVPRDQANYVRNSVKATVDAYDGTVTLYAWDPSDPVLQTWMKAFPGVVEPLDAMPAAVLDHVRYPQDMFKIQRAIMSRYHVTDAASFYNGTDVWIVPNDPTVSPAQVFQPPYYLTLQMPDQEAPTFSLTTTFAPQRRQTLAAFMAVDSAPGDGYGTIRVLQLPSNTTIPGPQQVQNNFESDSVVASQLSLLRQGGSEVELGNLLSLPFNGGLLYVEPVFIRAAQDGYPLLRKVLVGYGSTVALENSLDVALAKVFGASPDATVDPLPDPDVPSGEGEGQATPTPTPTEPGDPATQLAGALARAEAAYEEGRLALARGDFAAYGQAQEELKRALDDAAAAEALLFPELVPDATTPAPSPTPTPEDTSGTAA
ncbi:MAG: UPF0182 family protein [Actinomycetota bacterium]|nr:UPF0182 family protein [Actinomycetota bacterium]